ncbi:MAG: hypothetical protein JWM19_5622 [Actinomycetia bacterium]|nr:hypothetical protein [Actinomycetes bacterium]
MVDDPVVGPGTGGAGSGSGSMAARRTANSVCSQRPCSPQVVMLAQHAHHGGRRGMLTFLLSRGDHDAASDVAQAHLLGAQVQRGGEHRLVGDGRAPDRLAPAAG